MHSTLTLLSWEIDNISQRESLRKLSTPYLHFYMQKTMLFKEYEN